MQLTTSFWDNFSSEGRMKKLWAEALRETDPQKSLALLRSVRKKLCDPPAFVHLWLPFLDTFFAREHVQSLDDIDLTDIEKMGRFLQQGTDQHEAPPAFAVWQRLIRTYNARGEYILACRLAEKLYTDGSSDEQTRVYCLRELARQRMSEERYVDMYIAYLVMLPDPQQETEIFQALDAFFTVDFSISDARLSCVNRVAQSLLALSIPTLSQLVPHLHSAKGVHALLIKAAPEEARDYFERAHQLNGTDRLVCLGLLACEIRLGRNSEVARFMQNSSLRDLLHDPDIAALLDLHKLIQWFDQPEIPGSLPLDASAITHLATFPLHRYVGDIAIATLGRCYLITGHAHLARMQFDLLMKNTLKLPQWGYYAAWAYALYGEGTRVADCFKQLVGWPECWTIACILLDVDQRLAEQTGAIALLKNIAATEAPAALVIRSRLALAQTGMPIRENIWAEAAYPLEEALEALRTSLAQAIALEDLEFATSLVTHSKFARLPLADQKFWLSLVERDRARSLSLLEQVVGNWQYQRATLFLLVRFLHQGNWSQAGRYLEQALSGRKGLIEQLIRLYIEGREAHLDDAIQLGEQLAALGTERAYYILGNLYFYKAVVEPQQAQQARLRAALAWQRLLATGQTMLPRDLPVLAACASFIAYPKQRATSALTLIQSFQDLDVVLRQPWLEWHVALALLWYGTPQALTSMHSTILNMVEMAGHANDATIAALARALSWFTYKLKESMTFQQFLELLERLAQQSTRPASKHVLSSVIITGQRALYQSADKHQRAQIEKDLRCYLTRDSRNGLFVLWQACIVLHNNRREEAVMLLQTMHSGDPSLTYLSKSLLSLLKGVPLEDTALPADELLTDLSRNALSVARAVASGHAEEAYNLLLRHNTSKVLAAWRMERILPSLCMYIQRKGITPPAFLTSMLHRWRPVAVDSATLVNLAWCASMLGNVEDVCRLWEEALRNSIDDERHINWRQDFVRFLCRLAVIEYAVGQGLEATSKLRLAARWTMHEFGLQLSQTRLLDYARTFELRVVTIRLLKYLFPDFDNAGTFPGRYHALGLTLAHSPQLIEALISQDREQIHREWKKMLREQHDNMRFLHTLSVLYREVAFSKQAQHLDTEKDWMTSTALWILLLSTDGFWQYFAEGREAGAQDEPRKLNARQREEIWQDALDNILVFHSTIARKSLAAGKQTQARIHARCLALGRQSVQRLIEQLERAELIFLVNINQKRLEQIRSQTQRLLNEWRQSLLTEAEQSINDVNSIARLPRGIRKNYAGGIGVLEAFIRLDVPLTRVLLACLNWYNEWCSDLNLNGTRAHYRETAEAAGRICERLQRQCDRKNYYEAENQAIALHLIHRGNSLAEREPECAAHFYEEAIAWGASNFNLDERLDEVRLRSLEEIATRYADNQQFEEAYEAITQAEPLIKRQDAVRTLRMKICFRHARALEAQGRYTEALSRAKQALALVPEHTILQQFIREVEELVPEEGHAQSIHEAEQALEKQDFSQVHQWLARIPPGSRLSQRAQNIRKQALQQQENLSRNKTTEDEEPLDEQKLAEREAHLRLVLESSKPGENRAKAREELSMILARRSAGELEQAKKLDEQQQNLRYARLSYTRVLAEEALELDLRNAVAKQVLQELEKLLQQKKGERKG